MPEELPPKPPKTQIIPSPSLLREQERHSICIIPMQPPKSVQVWVYETSKKDLRDGFVMQAQARHNESVTTIKQWLVEHYPEMFKNGTNFKLYQCNVEWKFKLVGKEIPDSNSVESLPMELCIVVD